MGLGKVEPVHPAPPWLLSGQLRYKDMGEQPWGTQMSGIRRNLRRELTLAMDGGANEPTVFRVSECQESGPRAEMSV